VLFGALLRLEKAIPLEAALLPILPRPFSARSSAGAITSVCSSSEAVLADWLPDLDPFDLDPLDEREPAAERCSFLSSSELDARDDAREEACSSLSSSLSDDATTRNRPARLEGSPPFFFSSWRRAHALCASFSSAWSRAACMRRRAVAPIRRSPTPPSSTAGNDEPPSAVSSCASSEWPAIVGPPSSAKEGSFVAPATPAGRCGC